MTNLLDFTATVDNTDVRVQYDVNVLSYPPRLSIELVKFDRTGARLIPNREQLLELERLAWIDYQRDTTQRLMAAMVAHEQGMAGVCV